MFFPPTTASQNWVINSPSEESAPSGFHWLKTSKTSHSCGFQEGLSSTKIGWIFYVKNLRSNKISCFVCWACLLFFTIKWS